MYSRLTYWLLLFWLGRGGASADEGGMILKRFARMLAAGILLVSATAWSANADEINIAFNSDWNPYSSGDGPAVSGDLVGFVSELVAEATGQHIRVTGLPWARAQREVELGRLDAIVTYPSSERLGYAKASQDAVFYLETRAFLRVGSAAHSALRKSQDIETHHIFRHCIMLGDGWSQEFMKENRIIFDTARETDGCLKQIDAGRQDIFLHVSGTTRYSIERLGLSDRIIAMPKIYAAVPLHLIVSKKSGFSGEFLETFDRGMARLKKSGRFAALLAKYTSPGDELVLASLDLPPFVSDELPFGGAINEIVGRAFATGNGRPVRTDLLPWKRAIAYAGTGMNRSVGFFPATGCHYEAGFLQSDVIGTSTLAVAERSTNDVSWEKPEDLCQYQVGTVVGYANTDEFDELVEQGLVTTVSAHDDKGNLLKLAEGKTDIALIDRQVFNYLMSTDPDLVRYRRTIRLDEKIMGQRSLHLCLRDDVNGRKLMTSFNAGLKQVNPDMVWDDLYARLGSR